MSSSTYAVLAYHFGYIFTEIFSRKTLFSMNTFSKMPGFIVVVLFLFAFSAEAQNTQTKTFAVSAAPLKVNLKQHFYKKMQGKLGDKPMEIDLMRNGALLEGHFYFKDHEEKGNLIGTIRPNGRFSLEEREYNSKTDDIETVGVFTGVFSGPKKITGKWTDIEGKEELSFGFEEECPDAAACFSVKHMQKELTGKAKVVLMYVEMDEKTGKASKKINDFIQAHILNYDHPTSSKKQFKHADEFLEDFIKRYEKKGGDALWNNNHHIVVDYNNHNILALEFVESISEGEGYKKDKVHFVNFDLETGKTVSLKDILKDAYEENLNAAGEDAFRSHYGFKDIKSLKAEGFLFKDDKFGLNQNFSISKGGLLFRFDEGEIAPSAMGAFEIFIPYSKIKKLIRKKSRLEEIMSSYY